MRDSIAEPLRTVRRWAARSPLQLRFRDLVLRVGRNNPYVVREDLARRYLAGDGIEIGAQTLGTFPDASVDFIIANHVIEHLQDPIGALEEFLRIARPGGIVFLTLPDARHSFDRLRERTTVEHLLRDHADGPQTSLQQHYAEWATYIEGIGPEGVPARAAEYAASDAHHHFHVWELETFLALLGALDLGCELAHAQMNRDEFAVVLRKC